MAEFLGTVFETISISRVRFSTKPGGNVRTGELIQIEINNKLQLGSVSSIDRRNYLIDQDGAVQLSSLFEGNPKIDVSSIGVRGDFNDFIVGEIEILGRREKNERIFRRPRIPVTLGARIYKAETEFLKEQLEPEGSFIEIGKFRLNSEVPIKIDINELISKHFCVLAMTGSGKSWTISVLIEQIAKNFDFPLIIFDPHGEYSALKCSTENSPDSKISDKTKVYVVSDEFIKQRQDEMFENKFNISRNSQRICVNIGDLETYQILFIMEQLYELSEAQRRILQAGWSDVQRRPDLRGSVNIRAITSHLETVSQQVTRGASASNILNTKLEMFFDQSPFIRKAAEDPLVNIKDIAKKGQITVIDMSGLQDIHQQAFVAIIASQLLNERMLGHIPPILTIFEEAHRFIPGGNSLSASKPTLKRIAQEGRKFLMGLCVVSQRPSRLDSDVLSQCNTQIIMRLTNPNDQNYVKQISEYVTNSELEEIRALSPGEAYIFGSAAFISLPTIISNERSTKHGGYSPKIEEEMKKF